MTPEFAKYIQPIVAAYASGESVQHRRRIDTSRLKKVPAENHNKYTTYPQHSDVNTEAWVTDESPNFSDKYDWRIAEPPKLRPFYSVFEVNNLQSWFFRLKEHTGMNAACAAIVAIEANGRGVRLHGNEAWIGLQALFQNYVSSEGIICGFLESQEGKKRLVTQEDYDRWKAGGPFPRIVRPGFSTCDLWEGTIDETAELYVDDEDDEDY